MRHSILHRAGTTRALTSDAWPALIASGGYEAIIFDCDGTLVESSTAHFQAFQSAIRAQGFEMEKSWYAARTGLDRRSIIAEFASTIDGPFDIPMAIQGSITAFITDCTAVLPISETITFAKSLGPSIKCAVATNSEKDVAAASLASAGLTDLFDHIVTISDGLLPKPAPDLFITAAMRLNAPLPKTLVFEDSKEGVCGAMCAGLDVVEIMPAGVTTG